MKITSRSVVLVMGNMIEDAMTIDPLEIALTHFSLPDFRRDPVAWVSYTTGGYCWSKSREIVEMVNAYDRVAIKACHDSSKSWSMAHLASWWIANHPVGTARVITTAPTNVQVRAILWNEMNAVYAQAEARGHPLPGRMTQTEWWIESYQAGLGRKPSDHSQAHFSGLHAEHILVIIDEGGAVPLSVFDAAETIATNEGAKICTIGNPDDPQAFFKRIFDEPELGYKTSTISAWDTPNFTGEKVPDIVKRVLIQPKWVEQRRHAWGEDHPFWASKVNAEFPLDTGLTVVKALDLQACSIDSEELVGLGRSRLDDGIIQLGVDVAGSEKGDKTVCRERRGRELLRRWEIQSGDPTLIENFIVSCALESGCSRLAIDSIGVGFGFIAGLRRRLPRVTIIPVDVRNGAPTKTTKGGKQYRNLRAELWWEYGRELSRLREWDLVRAEGQEDLIADLSTPRYKTEKGVITVEAKDEIRKRLGRSPDDGDAALLSVITPGGTGKAKVSSASQRTLPTGRSSNGAAPGATRGLAGGRGGRGGRGIVGGMPTRR